MNQQNLSLTASLLIIVGLGLIVWGFSGSSFLWQVGLGVVGLAMLLSLLTRWAPEPQKEDSGEGSAKEGD